MDIQSYKHVYISGIGGIGTSAVAKFFHAQGVLVSGSDAHMSEITKELSEKGIQVFDTQSSEHMASDIDLFIYSLAIAPHHPQRVKAQEMGIQMLSYPEFLGRFSEHKKTIAISGTHGKSTTTALTGLILQDAELDPTVFVGSWVDAFEHKNVRVGMSDLFVTEACEYKESMNFFSPTTIVLTNIEFDHPDYYTSIDQIKKAFGHFIKKIPSHGHLIFNHDDIHSLAMVEEFPVPGKIISFGAHEEADIRFSRHRIKPGKQLFDVYFHQTKLDEFELFIPGTHNVYNAMGAIAVGLMHGVSVELMKKTIREFKGIWRRFQIMGSYKGNENTIIVSDYGHHPTAIKTTLQGAKSFYEGKRIVLVYQPHQHARTKQLFSEFVTAFQDADKVFLADIYDVAGREEHDLDISSQRLSDEVKKQGVDVIATGSLEQTFDALQSEIIEGDLVIVMGAGDIHELAKRLIQ